jgi:hypothetical protein
MIDTNSPFYMAGTEGTGSYIVIALIAGARIGFRALPDAHFRIRVEPGALDAEGSSFEPADTPDEALTAALADGWKRPDAAQNRFSIVVHEDAALRAHLSLAVVAALEAANRREVRSHTEKDVTTPAPAVTNDEAPIWARDLVNVAKTDARVSEPALRTAFAAALRAKGVKAANRRWGLTALRAAAASL